MSTPEQPPKPPAPPAGTATPAAAPAVATPTAAASTSAASTAADAAKKAAPAVEGPLFGHKPKPPPAPLPGWKGALEHTGIPRSVLTWKPKLPGPKMSVFLATVGTLTFAYYYDSAECKRIKKEYIDKVSYLAQQPTKGSLDEPRRVKVYGARWPDDDDTDRCLRYFRRYVKPYLAAAAIDYEPIHAPLHGSVARIVRADQLRKRREALGLQEAEQFVPLPVALDRQSAAQRELEGGTVIVGRHTFKEYMSGMKAGWGNGVGAWKWEDDVEKDIANDGVFEEKVSLNADLPAEVADAAVAAAAEPKPSHTNLSFLSRAPPIVPTPAAPQAGAAAKETIPEEWNSPPAQLPAQPPMLLVPFMKHLGFKQIPYMLWDMFNERRKVQEGAELAYALITNTTRPFVAPETADALNGVRPDTDFDISAEGFYKKNFYKTPKQIDDAREEYYPKLAERLESARQFARGERGLTDAEKKSDKPITTEDDLRAERRKRELRWHGNLEGFEIVKPEAPLQWDSTWAGWLNVFDPKAAKAREAEAAANE